MMWVFFFRAEAVGNRSLAGDEHAIQVLVLLPPGELQPQDVRGIQGPGLGGRR